MYTSLYSQAVYEYTLQMYKGHMLYNMPAVS